MMHLENKLGSSVKSHGGSGDRLGRQAPSALPRPELLTDPGITTLSEVLDPIVLAKHLCAVSRAPWNGGTVEEVQVRVLRHHVRQRCTLEIGVRTEKTWRFLIGKVYQADCTDVFQAMEGIRQAGFGPQDEFSIPQPIAYLPSLRLLLQEKVEGPTAGDVFKAGGRQDHSAVAKRCARWLARFHAFAPRAGPVSHPHEHLGSKSMQRYSRKMAKLGGPLGDKAAQLLQQLEHAASSLSSVEGRAGHGSYSAAHVILASGRTVAIDWDFHDVADPARDVARFLAALRRRALIRLGSIRVLDEAAEAFLGTYLAVGSPEAKKNLRFFEAATYLNLAGRHLGDEVPDAQERTEAMLDEGLRVMEGEII